MVVWSADVGAISQWYDQLMWGLSHGGMVS